MSQAAPQQPQHKEPGPFAQLLLAAAHRIAPSAHGANQEKESEETALARYRRQIESFEEDHEGLGAMLVRKVFTLLAYLAPFLVAFFIGKEIGDYYGGTPLNLDDGWNGGMHIASWFGEAALAQMVISTARCWRQYKKDSGSSSWLTASGVAFILFTLASCFAQWVIADAHIHPQVFSDYAALIFRVAMPTGVDVAAMLWLGIMGHTSLKQYLAEKEQKAQSIRLLNEAEIAIEDAQASAKQRHAQAAQYIEGQAAMQTLILRIGQIQGQAMIETAQRALSKDAALQIVAPTQEGEKAEAQNHHRADAPSFRAIQEN